MVNISSKPQSIIAVFFYLLYTKKIICMFAAMPNATVIYKGPEQVWGTLATQNVFVTSEASSYYSVRPEAFKSDFN